MSNQSIQSNNESTLEHIENGSVADNLSGEESTGVSNMVNTNTSSKVFSEPNEHVIPPTFDAMKNPHIQNSNTLSSTDKQSNESFNNDMNNDRSFNSSTFKQQNIFNNPYPQMFGQHYFGTPQMSQIFITLTPFLSYRWLHLHHILTQIRVFNIPFLHSLVTKCNQGLENQTLYIGSLIHLSLTNG